MEHSRLMLPDPKERIYRRTKTNQSDIGWNPVRKVGTGLYEASVFEEPPMYAPMRCLRPCDPPKPHEVISGSVHAHHNQFQLTDSTWHDGRVKTVCNHDCTNFDRLTYGKMNLGLVDIPACKPPAVSMRQNSLNSLSALATSCLSKNCRSSTSGKVYHPHPGSNSFSNPVNTIRVACAKDELYKVDPKLPMMKIPDAVVEVARYDGYKNHIYRWEII